MSNSSAIGAYQPSASVQYGHLLSGYSSLLSGYAAPYVPLSFVQSNTTSATSVNSTMVFDLDYAISIGAGPTFLFVLGFLTLVIFSIFLCCRCCCYNCCDCTPTGKIRKKLDTAATKALERAALYGQKNERAERVAAKEEATVIHKDIVRKRQRLGIFFAIMCLVVFIFDSLHYFTDFYLATAYTEYGTSFANLLILVSNLEVKGSELADMGATVDQALDLANITCDSSGMNQLYPYIEEYTSQINSMNMLVSTARPQVASASDAIELYLGGYRQIAVYFLWALPLLCILIFIRASCAHVESKACLSGCGLILGQISFFVAIFVCLPTLLISLGIADMCISSSPLNTLGAQVPEGGAKNITNYYFTCSGVNPFITYIEIAKSSSVQLYNSTTSLLQVCPNNYYLNVIRNSTLSLSQDNGTLDGMLTAVPCPTFKGIVTTLVEDNICGSSFDGIFSLALAQLFTSFTLFLSMIVLIVFMAHFQYMRKIHDETEGNYDDDDDDDSDDEQLEKENEEADQNVADEMAKDELIMNANEIEEASIISQVTEFDWTKLENVDGQEHKEDPYHNPNGRPSIDAIDEEMFDIESLDSYQTALSIEDVVHHQAINDAGLEDDL